MLSTPPTTNRLAIYSFSAALLTLLSFCIGVAPIPLTATVCYPLALTAGAAAIIIGWRALKQMRTSGENGRTLALTGIWVGALSILAVLCAASLTALILYYGVNYLQKVFP